MTQPNVATLKNKTLEELFMMSSDQLPVFLRFGKRKFAIDTNSNPPDDVAIELGPYMFRFGRLKEVNA